MGYYYSLLSRFLATAPSLHPGDVFLPDAWCNSPFFRFPHYITMTIYRSKIVDRQVGRNAELFAQAIGEMETPEERYPYLRILISILEQAHPEWNQAPHKDRQMSHLIHQMSNDTLDMDEVAEIVRVRDEERGYFSDQR